MASAKRESESRKREMTDLFVLPRPAVSLRNGADIGSTNKCDFKLN